MIRHCQVGRFPSLCWQAGQKLSNDLLRCRLGDGLRVPYGFDVLYGVVARRFEPMILASIYYPLRLSSPDTRYQSSSITIAAIWTHDTIPILMYLCLQCSSDAIEDDQGTR